ncbi:MAG: prepilin-type N-terminal cleavage/methylation domain-containing protein [Verrucomicrobia bacterium]|nr:prepilin-type N-terminal cleavage/methylation domain-containing protein [Verrucomicrobiota bacterium]
MKCEKNVCRDGLLSQGLTLLELLVTVGMIAVLAAMLYPALRRSKQAGETAACLGNLRQIGVALQAYVNENNLRMPVLQNRDSATNAVPSMDTVLLPGVPVSRVFQCPSDRSHLFEQTGTSYFWNFTVNGQDINNLFSVAGGSDPVHIPLVSDKEGFHPDSRDRVNILYADGRASKELKFSTSLP